MANKHKVDKHFVSEIDKKLAEFDRSHEPSPAQQAEIDKYKRVYKLRDDASASDPEQDDIWQ